MKQGAGNGEQGTGDMLGLNALRLTPVWEQNDRFTERLSRAAPCPRLSADYLFPVLAAMAE